MPSRALYLCAGTQSSGSTLISWCFLQRPDTDGILDARFDKLPQMPPLISAPLAWCKFTIACFRMSEVMDYFTDEGWDVKPMLVVRDARSVFNSLITKTYGRNGTTADDPPLRLRLSRFLEDWELFTERGWPILRYEDLADDPLGTIRKSCQRLGIAYDDAMNTWPKPREQIADATFGNETFIQTRGGTFEKTVDPSLFKIKTGNIPPDDLQWLETRFAAMNRAMNYPEHVPPQAPATPSRAIPTFENTRRHDRYRRKRRLSNSIRKITDAVRGMLPTRDKPAATFSPETKGGEGRR
ncbi:MAG TPA: hypothetical protein VG326_18565 [Tepidisphaeraceae bacterium]|nr:hypothetical protein [Tepidisphaeraceae bacterium]